MSNLCSFVLCQFVHCLSLLDSFLVCFWENFPSARLCIACFSSQVSRYLDGSFMFLPMIPFSQTFGEKNNPICCISSWNLFEYLCQSKQRRISCNTFFLRSIPFGAPFGAQQWKFVSSLSIFVAFLEQMCPRQGLKTSGPENVPKPRLPPYRSPLSAVSSTCKEITSDKCYGSARLALFTASLTKKCVVWNCALNKWQCLHMSSQWEKCHKIDMNSSWSVVGPAPEGTSSMHSSWCEHRGACAECHSLESHLFMEGGFVCE